MNPERESRRPLSALVLPTRPLLPPLPPGLQLRRLLRREITVSPSVLHRNREGPQTQAWFLGTGPAG